jgi:hypothetical protein
MYSDTEMDALDVFAILDSQVDLFCIGDSQTPSEGPLLDRTEDVNIPDSPGSICMLPDDFYIPDIPNPYPVSPHHILPSSILQTIPDSPDHVIPDSPLMRNGDHTLREIPESLTQAEGFHHSDLRRGPIEDLMDICAIPLRPLSVVSNPQPEPGPSRLEPERQQESTAERSFKALKKNLLPYLPVLLTRTSLLRAQLAQLIMERDMMASYLDGSVTKILEIDRYLHGLRALQLIRGEGVRDEEAGG